MPIWLTLTSSELPTPQLDALLQARRVRDEEVVADELDLRAELLGEVLPAVPVVLVERVLDRDDRVGVGELDVVVGERLGRPGLALERVDAVLEELGRGDIHAERDVGADGLKPAFSIALTRKSSPSRLLLRSGANPPSSPRPVA